MVAQHYRWDFVGLSTDTKPTPETSEKVVDGSTFYCSDTSKLYVFCKTNWYERKSLGGGGGGTSYTAGDGIDITDNTISVDTNTIQPKLTAGENITITDNVISASGGGGGGGVTTLTTSDYNFPAANPNCIALWLLPVGQYVIDKSVKVLTDANGSIISQSYQQGVIVLTSNAAGAYYNAFIFSSFALDKYYKVDSSGNNVSGFPHDI